MSVAQSPRQTNRNLNHQLLGECRPVSQKLRQCASVAVFVDNGQARFRQCLVNGHNVRMVQRSGRPGFRQKASSQFAGDQYFRPWHLNRHRTSELRIVCQIHRTETATSDQRPNPVSGEVVRQVFSIGLD